MNDIFLNKMMDIAIRATLIAGSEILKIYEDPCFNFSAEIKDDNSPLTIADKASHLAIVKELETTSIPILSEEGKHISYEERKKWNRFWLVDPIDGTKEFLKKNGEFTVNIALIENNRPILGVIFVPVTNELYIGNTEIGAWKYNYNHENIDFETRKQKGCRLPLNSKNEIYTIVGSRSHMNEETKQYISALRKEHKNVEIVSKGSSLKICMVAEGKANEYPRFGPTMEWDTAAGHAIANAAGKKLWCTDFTKELAYNKKDLLNSYFIVK